MKKVKILIPVYNDWENLNKLLIKINDLFFKRIKQKFDLIIIDDCSSEKSNFIKSKLSIYK